MGFAMVMGLRKSVVDGTLKHVYQDGRKMGYEFQIQMDYYRGHYLSTIDELSVKVDGKEVPEESILFCVNGKEFGIIQLKDAYTEFWEINKTATLEVYLPVGLEDGEHEIDLHMISRSPYMPLDFDNHFYMPISHCSCVKMAIK